MSNLQSTTSVAAILAVALGAASVKAASVSYELDFSFNYTADFGSDPGTLNLLTTYELDAAAVPSPFSSPAFDLTSFQLSFAGGLFDGVVFDDTNTSGVLVQFENSLGLNSALIFNQTVGAEETSFEFFFDSLGTVENRSAELDLTEFDSGFGYSPITGDAFISDFTLENATATTVPLPASGALLALAVGGLSLRNAAKKRRAARRAAAV